MTNSLGLLVAFSVRKTMKTSSSQSTSGSHEAVAAAPEIIVEGGGNWIEV